jgi:hypothetical protein
MVFNIKIIKQNLLKLINRPSFEELAIKQHVADIQEKANLNIEINKLYRIISYLCRNYVARIEKNTELSDPMFWVNNINKFEGK